MPATKRQAKPTGLAGVIRAYPWATTFVALLIVAAALIGLQQGHIGPFATHPAKAKVAATAKSTTTATTKAAATATAATTPAPPAQGCDLKTHECAKPPMTIDTSKTYTATIHTQKGNIVLALDPKSSPIAVNDFVYLADQHYYDGTYFWRVEKPGQPSALDGQPSQLSLIQGGSVTKTGQDSTSTPGYTIQDEPVKGNYTLGTVALAKTSQPNSASSQFFIDTADESKFFAKTYQIIGHVTSGMNVAQQIAADDVIQSISIVAK